MQLDYSTAHALAQLLFDNVDKEQDLRLELDSIAKSAKSKSGKEVKNLELNGDWVQLFNHNFADDHKNLKRQNAYPLMYLVAEYFDEIGNKEAKRKKINERFLLLLNLVDRSKPDWYQTIHLQEVIQYAMEKGAPAEYFSQLLPCIPEKAMHELLELALENSPAAFQVFFDALERTAAVNSDRYIRLVETAIKGNQFNKLNALLTQTMLVNHKISPEKRSEWISALISAEPLKLSSTKENKDGDYALFVSRLLDPELDTEHSKLTKNPIWLFTAVAKEKYFISSVLLKHGFSPNTVIEETESTTVMHIAAKFGYINVLKLLNQFGADFRTQNKQGKTPGEVAKGPNKELTLKVIEDFIQVPVEEKKEDDGKITHLAIRGGGVKGGAYPETIREAEKQNLFKLAEIKGVAGASAGAITAGLIALNYSSDELDVIMRDLDFKSFFDFHSDKTETELDGIKATISQYSTGGISFIPAFFNSIGTAIKYLVGASSINTFAEKKGLAKGDKFLAWIDQRIKEQVYKVLEKRPDNDFTELKARTKPYEVSLKLKDTVLEKGKLYVEYSSSGLKCTILNQEGNVINDTISVWDLNNLLNLNRPANDKIKLIAPLNDQQIADVIVPNLPAISDKLSSKLYDPSLVTFKDLKDLGFKDLRVVATDVNRQQALWFSAEETPNAIVADAIRSSMSYPGMFSPHQYYIRQKVLVKDEQKDQRVVHPLFKDVDLGDGGMMDNFPVRAFDKKPGTNQTTYNEHVLGLYLATPEEKRKFEYGITPNVTPITNGFAYLGGIVNSLIAHQEQIHSESMDTPRTVYINTGDVGAMDLNMGQKEKDLLAANGRQSIHDFMSRRVGQKLMDKLSESTLSLLIRLVGKNIQKIEPGRTVIHLDNLYLDPYQIVTLYANCKQDELAHLQALVNPNNARDEQGNSALHVALAAKGLFEINPKLTLQSERLIKIDLALDRLKQISANPEAKNSSGQTPQELVEQKNWAGIQEVVFTNEFLFSDDEYRSLIRGKIIEEEKATVKDLQQDNKVLTHSNVVLSEQLTIEKRKAEAETNQNAKALAEMRAAHALELAKLKEEHKSEIGSLKQQHADELSRVKADAKQEKSRLVAEYREDVNGLNVALKKRSVDVSQALLALKTHRGVLELERADYEPTHNQYKLKTKKMEAIDALMSLEESDKPQRAIKLNPEHREIIRKGFFSRGETLLDQLDEAEALEHRYGPQR